MVRRFFYAAPLMSWHHSRSNGDCTATKRSFSDHESEKRSTAVHPPLPHSLSENVVDSSQDSTVRDWHLYAPTRLSFGTGWASHPGISDRQSAHLLPDHSTTQYTAHATNADKQARSHHVEMTASPRCKCRISPYHGGAAGSDGR